MAVTAPENATVTTDAYTTAQTVADQRSPTTRRLSVDATSELETSEIERNAEFHATVVRRIETPGRVVEATELFPDL